MNVAEIIELIARISFNDDNPSTDDRERILSYVNLADREIYKAVAQIGSAFLSKSTTLTLTSGAVDLPTDFFKTLRAIDVTNNRVLDAEEIESLEEDDPALSASGSPSKYYLDGGQIKVYPTEDIDFKLRYTPARTTLVDNDDELQIKYPDEHTPTLFQKALYYMFFDERDIRTALEIAESVRIGNDGLHDLINYYKNESRKPTRVVGTDF